MDVFFVHGSAKGVDVADGDDQGRRIRECRLVICGPFDRALPRPICLDQDHVGKPGEVAYHPGSTPPTLFLESIPEPTTTAGASDRAFSVFARRSPASSEVTSGPIMSASLFDIFVVGATRTFIPCCVSPPETARIAPDLPPAPTKAATSPE